MIQVDWEAQCNAGCQDSIGEGFHDPTNRAASSTASAKWQKLKSWISSSSSSSGIFAIEPPNWLGQPARATRLWRFGRDRFAVTGPRQMTQGASSCMSCLLLKQCHNLSQGVIMYNNYQYSKLHVITYPKALPKLPSSFFIPSLGLPPIPQPLEVRRAASCGRSRSHGPNAGAFGNAGHDHVAARGGKAHLITFDRRRPCHWRDRGQTDEHQSQLR